MLSSTLTAERLAARKAKTVAKRGQLLLNGRREERWQRNMKEVGPPSPVNFMYIIKLPFETCEQDSLPHCIDAPGGAEENKDEIEYITLSS